MSCLITLDNLKALWSVAKDDVANDDQFRALIQQCSARIETFCRRVFATADYTEFVNGTGTRYLPLRQRPINTVANVWEDNNGYWGQSDDPFPSTTLLTAGTDYMIVKEDGPLGKSGMLYRRNGLWPKWDVYESGKIAAVPTPAPGNIKVEYNAGFSTIPYDVQQACAFLCASVRRTIKLGAPTSSEAWEDYNYTLANLAAAAIGGLPPDSLGALSSYRNTAWG